MTETETLDRVTKLKHWHFWKMMVLQFHTQWCLSASVCPHVCPVFFFVYERQTTGLCWGQYMSWNGNMWVVASQTHMFVLCRLYTQTYSVCSDVGSNKSLVWFLFFCATQHCTPKTTCSFLTFWKVHFGDGRWDQIRFQVFYTFWRSIFYRLHVVFSFFSYCDDNCVSPNKPLSDGFIRRCLFGESEASTCH